MVRLISHRPAAENKNDDQFLCEVLPHIIKMSDCEKVGKAPF